MIQHSVESNYKMVPYSNATSSYMALGRFNEDCGSMAFAFSSLVKISSAVAFSLRGGGGGGGGGGGMWLGYYYSVIFLYTTPPASQPAILYTHNVCKRMKIIRSQVLCCIVFERLILLEFFE